MDWVGLCCIDRPVMTGDMMGWQARLAGVPFHNSSFMHSTTVPHFGPVATSDREPLVAPHTPPSG